MPARAKCRSVEKERKDCAEGDEFPVEIRREAIAKVTVWEEIGRYFEFRQQTERSANPLKGSEFPDHLLVAVEEVADEHNFLRSELSVEIR